MKKFRIFENDEERHNYVIWMVFKDKINRMIGYKIMQKVLEELEIE